MAFLQSATVGVEIDRFFHGTAPELVDPQRFRLTDTGATKESDVYSLGVVGWQVILIIGCLMGELLNRVGPFFQIFTGQVPFSDEGWIAGVHSMLSGRRPPRPNHPELSDHVWGVIRGCWECVPSQRRRIAEVVAALDADLNLH